MLMPSIFGENLFDEFFDDFPVLNDRELQQMEKKLYGRRAGRLMKTDIQDLGDRYQLEIDLPGFRKDEVQVSLENGYLTICAAKGLKEEQKDDKSGRYIRRERYCGTCSRSFYVGEGVLQEDIQAAFKHGILKLTVPKKEAKPVVEENQYIKIEG